SEALPGFDGRSREDDAGDSPLLEGFYSRGNREIGLTGTRRPQRDGQAMLLDGRHQTLLPKALRPNVADVALLAPRVGRMPVAVLQLSDPVVVHACRRGRSGGSLGHHGLSGA